MPRMFDFAVKHDAVEMAGARILQRSLQIICRVSGRNCPRSRRRARECRVGADKDRPVARKQNLRVANRDLERGKRSLT